MEIKFLYDCPEFIPAVACIQQMEMRTPRSRNYSEAINKYVTRSLNRNNLPLALVAIQDSLPVGSVSLIHCELEPHQHLTPWVATLFVSTHYRNQGIGMQLMNEVESVASSLGYDKLYLYTDLASEFYRKIKWDLIETVHPDGKPVSLLMSKKLSQQDTIGSGLIEIQAPHEIW